MRAFAAIAMALALLGCAEPQAITQDLQRACPTWKQDVLPFMTSRCETCHGAASAQGGYRTDSYLGAIEAAKAGDATSTLLKVLGPAGDATHRLSDADFAKLKRWVVDCDLGFEKTVVHELGLMNPASPDFHGAAVRKLAFGTSTCAKCHGGDLAGGAAKVSCTTCHADPVSGCTSCHGQPPPTGAHVAHVVTAAVGRKLACVECHVVPVAFTDAGHLHTGPGNVDLSGGVAGATASYDATAKTCKNVTCHGGKLADPAASNTAPAWTGGTSQAACGTCHGLPPANHRPGMTNCQACHSEVVDAQRKIIDTSKHIDGKVEEGGATCTSCHAQPPATGAHLAHVTGEHGLRGPLDCSACHVVPAKLDSPGHMDGIAGVFTAGMSGLAYAFDAAPAWTKITTTCDNVYCHGNGSLLLMDTSPNLLRSPTWVADTTAIQCGSCHGLPPKDGLHPVSTQLSDCARCHSATMLPTGVLRVVNGTSTHMNGVLDGNL